MDNRSTRLTAVGAAVVAVIAVIALVMTTYMNMGTRDPGPVTDQAEEPLDGRPAPHTAVAASPTGTENTPGAEDPTGDGHDVEEYTPDKEVRSRIQDVAVRFVDAWKTPGTPEERTSALRPLATEHLTRLLARVDPRELPTKAKVEGRPELVAATPYAAGVVVGLSDGTRVRVNLLIDETGWRVTEILPIGQGG